MGMTCGSLGVAQAQSFQPQVLPTKAHSAAVPGGWKIAKTWSTTVPGDGGFAGQLQLLADVRWSPALEQAMRADAELCTDNTGAWGPTCASIRKQALKMAHLRLVDAAGRVVDDLEMERPGLGVQVLNLYGSQRRTYQLETDESAGFGSYNGMITMFVEVRGGHLQWLQSQQGMNDAPQRMRFMSSLKTAWKLVPAAGGQGPEILEVACRPQLSSDKSKVRSVGTDGSDLDFFIVYRRFYLGDDQLGNGRTMGNAIQPPVWRVKSRSVKGAWEDEGPFPARKMFP